MAQEKRAGTESGYRPTHDQSGSHAQIVARPGTDALRAQLAKEKSQSELFLEEIRRRDVVAIRSRYVQLIGIAAGFQDKRMTREDAERAAMDVKNYREAIELARTCEAAVRSIVESTVVKIYRHDEATLKALLAA